MKNKEYICELCQYITTVKCNYNKHCATKRHTIKVNEINENKKLTAAITASEAKRRCNICDIIFTRKSSLIKHNERKHSNLNVSTYDARLLQKSQKIQKNETKNNTCIEYSENGVVDQNAPEHATNEDSDFKTNVYKCSFCDTLFVRQNGRSKHEAKCSVRKMQELERKYKEKEMEKNKQIDMLLEDKKNLMELSIQTSKTSSKALSALSYIVYHYTDAKALDHICDDDLKQIVYAKKQEDIHMARIFIMYHRAKSLHKHIGDAIVKVYKEDNPNDQSFHTTDVSRLNYVVMTAIGDKKEWIQDKGGIKISDKIIDPIMTKVKKLVDDFIDDIKNDRENIGAEDQKAIFSIQDDMDDGKLQKQIHNYIAPYFKTEMNEAIKNKSKRKKKINK
jgi:hypothetical protein